MTDVDLGLRALEYVRKGWSPVPLWRPDECTAGRCSVARSQGACGSPGKHPRIRWKELDQVTAAQAMDWWRKWPDAGIGLLTGVRSGFDVIDVDPKAGGHWPDVVARGGVPDEPTVRSGSGEGCHLYVQHLGIQTSNGLDDAIDLDGCDYRGDGGLVVAPPTLHASGNRYEFIADELPDPAPCPAWLETLIRGAAERRQLEREASSALAARLVDHPAPAPPDGEASPFGHRFLLDCVQAIATADVGHHRRGRHPTVIRKARAVGGLIATGHVTEQHAKRILANAARAAVGDEPGRAAEMDQAVAWGLTEGARAPWEPSGQQPVTTLISAAPAALVDQLLAAAREYLDLPDPSHLVCVAATAATTVLDGDPLWFKIVGPSSGGKTEAIRALSDVAHAHLDDVTTAGLLTWKAGKNAREVGVLTRIPQRALVTFGDLSTLLATSDRGGRDQTFATLRKVYDGFVTRNHGGAPEELSWSGRVTVVAAVTGAIDNYTAHADALGSRWVYLRLPNRDLDGRRKIAALSRRGGLDDARQKLAGIMASLVTQAQRRIVDVQLDADEADAIDEAAIVTGFGRAAVPRHGYGRREIEGVAQIEEPGRFGRELDLLARGLIAIGLDRGMAVRTARRAALDSMPAARRAVLDVLADGEPVSTAEVGRRGDLHRHVARRNLEELEVIGVVAGDRAGTEPEEGEPDRRPVTWRLDGEDGLLIASVMQRHHRHGGWHESGQPPTPPPQDQETRGNAPHVSCHPGSDVDRGAA